MSVPDDIRACLEEQLNQHEPRYCLQIAPPEALQDWAHRGVVEYPLDAGFDAKQKLSMLESRVQLAVVIDAPRVLSCLATRQLLARLRNCTAGAIVAAFAIERSRRDERWSISEFLGLGFRRLDSARQLESRYWVYRYDIYDYKITPAWLNSRYWANPDRWGKHRW